jgi:hypothetical protein
MKQDQMTKRMTTLWVLTGLGVFVACSGNNAVGAGSATTAGGAAGTIMASNAGGTTGESTSPPTAGSTSDPCLSGRCTPSQVPFADAAIAVSDTCGSTCPLLAADTPPGETTATLSQPKAGTLCLSGVVSPGGWAQIVLVFAVRNQERTAILRTFDANALGITQMEFTIDSPPSGGVSVSAAITTALSCPDGLFGCFTYGFDLMIAPGSSVPANYTTPGPVIAPFADFKQTVDTQTFNTSALEHVVFSVGVGSYDFCIRDFKFLDAQSNEVIDTQRLDGGA